MSTSRCGSLMDEPFTNMMGLPEGVNASNDAVLPLSNIHPTTANSPFLYWLKPGFMDLKNLIPRQDDALLFRQVVEVQASTTDAGVPESSFLAASISSMVAEALVGVLTYSTASDGMVTIKRRRLLA